LGQLRIVPSGQIGGTGEQEVKASTYEWKWYYNLPGLLLWLALALAMVTPKSNRNPHVLLVFVPLLFMNLLYVAFKKISGMPSSSALQFDAVFQSLAIGMAVLWLLAPRLASLHGFARFLLSLCIMAGTAFLGVLSVGWDARETALLFLFPALVGGVLLAGAAAAGRLCRWRYLPGRFMLWLGLCVVAGTTAVTCVFFLAVLTVTRSGLPDLGTMVWQIGLVGSMMGLCLYVLSVPFMILGFVHPFFRDRLRTCLSLRTPDAPGDTVGTAPATNPPPQMPLSE
jgi:hypothetical protein